MMDTKKLCLYPSALALDHPEKCIRDLGDKLNLMYILLSEEIKSSDHRKYSQTVPLKRISL